MKNPLFIFLLLASCQRDKPLSIDSKCGTVTEQKDIVEHKNLKSAVSVVIPIVVHVVYNTPGQNISEAQIRGQVDILNADFARLNADAVNTPDSFKTVAGSSKIQFRLAYIERRQTSVPSFACGGYIKSYATGGLDAWDCTQYLNIWVGNLTGCIGYASYPNNNPAHDGIVIKWSAFGISPSNLPAYNKGRTATHETGHWLHLYHTFGNGMQNGQCDQDLIDDTPISATPNLGCPSFPRVRAGCGAQLPNGEMFCNYMDYSNDGCMNIFTQGQVGRFNWCIQTERSSFLKPKGLNANR